MARVNPDDLISYGPDANCVLDKSSPYYCPVDTSVYAYRPALGANITLLVLFVISLNIHAYQGFRWRTWWFSIAMVLGCVCDILGYGGRIMLYQDPFSFTGFMIQITTITFGPALFAAAIYFTLARITIYLGREYSRLPPKAYYYIFIPCDLISLALQGAGGGLSSSSSGGSTVAVDVSIAGLSFQVITICTFIAFVTDFAIRYRKGQKTSTNKMVLSKQFKVFAAFLSLAIIFILVRCAYRIAELKGGYRGPGSEMIREEAPFIALEGVMIILAAFCLNIGHPGPVFDDRRTVEE